MTKYVPISDMTSFTPLMTGITPLLYMTFVDRSAAGFSDKLAVSAFMVGSPLLRNVGNKLSVNIAS